MRSNSLANERVTIVFALCPLESQTSLQPLPLTVTGLLFAVWSFVLQRVQRTKLQTLNWPQPGQTLGPWAVNHREEWRQHLWRHLCQVCCEALRSWGLSSCSYSLSSHPGVTLEKNPIWEYTVKEEITSNHFFVSVSQTNHFWSITVVQLHFPSSQQLKF